MPPLPPLSAPDAALLDAFIAANHDLTALRARGHSTSELLAWHSKPDVQAHLRALRTLTDNALHLRAATDRVTALNTLEDLCRTSEEPIERRRADPRETRRLNRRARPHTIPACPPSRGSPPTSATPACK